MSTSLPHIARRSDDDNVVLIILGNVDDIFEENFPEFEHPKPISWSHKIMNANIPVSLRTLHILLGYDIAYSHQQMLKAMLMHTTDNCNNLESVCVLAYSTNWKKEWQDLIQEFRPRVRFTERIIDSQRTFEAMVTYSRSNWRTEPWQAESALMMPLDCVGSHGRIVRVLPKITRLCLSPPLNLLDNRRDVFNAFKQLLANSLVLHIVTFPLGLSPGLISICKESLPQRPWVIELTTSPEMAIPQELDLAACFRNFHGLQKLSLPSGILCNPLIDCLGDLQGLQEQTIVAMGPVPSVKPTHRPQDKFPALHTLILLGSTALQQDAEGLVHTFSGSRMNAIKKIKVEAESLSHGKEMKRTLDVILRYCPQIDHLDICIKGTTETEGSDWVDLSRLTRFNLRVFKIKHPRPIPLTDEDIRHLLKAWCSAESVSFNPRPTLPVKYSTRAAQSPTVDCLKHVARHGRNLRRFGVFLDPQPQYSLSSLEELDLGTVDVERTLLEPLFPNAIRV